MLADEPLTKVTLFLYTKDIETLKRREGYGYTSKVREIVHQWLKSKTTTSTPGSPEGQ